jgi:flagellar biosynthesis regulator FlbT
LRKIQTLEFNETGNKEQDDKFKTKIQEILTELENPEILLSISQDLKSQDPQAYKDFKSSVIELQPSFRARFDLIEPKLKLAL